MPQSVLMGEPTHFRIRSGANPHTRDRWGRRKRVDRRLARAQWERLRALLGELGVRVHVVEPVQGQPGLVFPANAGFRFGDSVYLGNLHPGRAGEREHYRSALNRIGSRFGICPARTVLRGRRISSRWGTLPATWLRRPSALPCCRHFLADPH